MSAPRAAVEQAFIQACELDVAAVKPGNVRHGHPAHGMTAQQFIDSARACAPDLCEAGASIGRRVLHAIRSTQQVVQCNTNLGIVLLAAPLCAAAQGGSDPGAHAGDAPARSAPELAAAVQAQLDRLGAADASQVYEAIRLARPGGMGTVPRNDIRSDPEGSLVEAMRSAAGRDSIARQYAIGFADVFGWGLDHWLGARRRGCDERQAATAVFMAFLARWPDSLIERKFGAATAQAVSARARQLLPALLDARGCRTEDDIGATLLHWDRELREAGLNPGTTADLTVATAFAAKLTRAV